MLRVEVSEEGQPALPAVDVDGDFTIGPAVDAKIRLPVGSPEVRVEQGCWRWVSGGPRPEARGPSAGPSPISDGVSLDLGRYRVRIAPAPAGSLAAPPQRTESLARELVRGMLGGGGAPKLEVERGPEAGASRILAPPESQLVVGRGDEADWVILDGDLSKRHAEVLRGWDGVRIRDLGSKNGTRVDGQRVKEAELHDGSLVELGKVRLRFRDPAERHLAGTAPRPAYVPAETVVRRGSMIVYYGALAIMTLALVGLVWLLEQ